MSGAVDCGSWTTSDERRLRTFPSSLPLAAAGWLAAGRRGATLLAWRPANRPPWISPSAASSKIACAWLRSPRVGSSSLPCSNQHLVLMLSNKTVLECRTRGLCCSRSSHIFRAVELLIPPAARFNILIMGQQRLKQLGLVRRSHPEAAAQPVQHLPQASPGDSADMLPFHAVSGRLSNLKFSAAVAIASLGVRWRRLGCGSLPERFLLSVETSQDMSELLGHVHLLSDRLPVDTCSSQTEAFSFIDRSPSS